MNTISFLCVLLIGLPINAEDSPQRVGYSLHRLKDRRDLGHICEIRGFKVGVELGVQRGHFAVEMLKRWRSVESYHLVDIWAPQKNYKDVANFDLPVHEKILAEATRGLRPWKDKVFFWRNYTSVAVKYFKPESVDFIYVDARHDYCGVKEDIGTWWPILKVGGVMAGHDYLTADEAGRGTQNWAICGDGITVNEGAVKGAVNEFAAHHGFKVYSTVNDGPWVSWVYPPKNTSYVAI
jgi:Methyltransferase domain